MSITALAFALAHAQANAQTNNRIAVENSKPGSSDWELGYGGRPGGDAGGGEIKGYASATSVSKGRRITFHVSLDKPQPYALDVYRLGWYGGAGGRLHKTVALEGRSGTRV